MLQLAVPRVHCSVGNTDSRRMCAPLARHLMTSHSSCIPLHSEAAVILCLSLCIHTCLFFSQQNVVPLSDSGDDRRFSLKQAVAQSVAPMQPDPEALARLTSTVRHTHSAVQQWHPRKVYEGAESASTRCAST
jgi:hypothetical protein